MKLVPKGYPSTSRIAEFAAEKFVIVTLTTDELGDDVMADAINAAMLTLRNMLPCAETLLKLTLMQEAEIVVFDS